MDRVGFSIASVYCKECGKILYYNGNSPEMSPKECTSCGGIMTDEQSEKLIAQLENDLNKAFHSQSSQISIDSSKQNPIQLLITLKSNAQEWHFGYIVNILKSALEPHNILKSIDFVQLKGENK